MRAYMPILGTCLAVRMDALDERQVQANHGQTLERLAERGGLSPSEAIAILRREPFRRRNETDAQLLAEINSELIRRAAATGDSAHG